MNVVLLRSLRRSCWKKDVGDKKLMSTMGVPKPIASYRVLSPGSSKHRHNLKTSSSACPSGQASAAQLQMHGRRSPDHPTVLSSRLLPLTQSVTPALLKTGLFQKERSVDAEAPREVQLRNLMTLQQLVDVASLNIDRVRRMLLDLMGTRVTEKTVLNKETMEFILSEMNIQWTFVHRGPKGNLIPSVKQPPSLRPRPPVVTIMGHVDHGKTTLLDKLQKSSRASMEAGGITQHIGAFSVRMPSGKSICFIDTPGHVVFNAMRSRGAQVTDIVVLVVAADDGVQPQTLESIYHARKAGVPIVVAVNKIDKYDAAPGTVLDQLERVGVVAEERGGPVQVVQLSALTGEGVSKLEEALIVESELADLTANHASQVHGSVIEVTTDKKYGLMSSSILRDGILRVGDIIMTTYAWAKVRHIINSQGQLIESAYPSEPVQISGWRDPPHLGDVFYSVNSEREAREFIEIFNMDSEKDSQDCTLKRTLSVLKIDTGNLRGGKLRRFVRANLPNHVVSSADKDAINFILRADVRGSLEVLTSVLATYKGEIGRLSLIHEGVGPPLSADVEAAAKGNGMILCFNVAAAPELVELAREKGVLVQSFRVLYDLVRYLKAEMQKRVPEKTVEKCVGEAVIKKTFRITQPSRRFIAGCEVVDGYLRNGPTCTWKFYRNGNQFAESKLLSMRQVQDDINVIYSGNECGLGFDDLVGYKIGDVVRCFEVTKYFPDIEWNPEEELLTVFGSDSQLLEAR